MFWLVATLLVFATAAALFLPLRWRASPTEHDSDDTIEADIAVYKDQLRELEEDRSRGLISESEADAARAEVSRRLLAVDARAAEQSSEGAANEKKRQSGYATVALAVAAPLLAIPLYLTQGKPSLENAPYAARVAKPATGSDRLNALIAKVEARLRETPNDGRGWEVIAPVYFGRKEYRKAANAFARSVEINGPSVKRLMGLGEAIVFTNDEIVTEPARLAFENVLKLKPDAIKARFWLALAKEQDGRIEEAITDYKALMARGSPEDNWFRLLSTRVFSLQRQNNIETGKTPPPDAPAAGGPEPSKPLGPRVSAAPNPTPEAPGRGPNQEQIDAARDMTPEQRQAMISSMVEGLADRLKQNPQDKRGWLMLIRSYAGSGRRDDARTALARARTLFKDDATMQQRLASLAGRLKLSGTGTGADATSNTVKSQ